MIKSQLYKLITREFKPKDTIIDINGVKIGGKEIIVFAGPCAVENEEQTIIIAKDVKKSGAKLLRGGAFKPRTSPYSFQGLGEQGLKILAKARKIAKMPIVTEVMDTETINLVCKYADVLQVGSRNAQNYSLLKQLGKCDKPILLKRGMSSTLEEFLSAAEYILNEGNPNVILCERGIRTFETSTRNTLDLNIVPLIKQRTHLPIIVDPSHGTGLRNLISPMSKAAIAAGADGLLIEVHNEPEIAKSDGQQSLNLVEFKNLMHELKSVSKAVGRDL